MNSTMMKVVLKLLFPSVIMHCPYMQITSLKNDGVFCTLQTGCSILQNQSGCFPVRVFYIVPSCFVLCSTCDEELRNILCLLETEFSQLLQGTNTKSTQLFPRSAFGELLA